MGWDGDPDKTAQDFEPFQYTVAALAAKSGYVFGVAEAADPDSKWTQVDPGKGNGDYGNVMAEVVLKNEDATTGLYYSRSQRGAQFVSADRAPLALGESVTLKHYAKLAIWNDDAAASLTWRQIDARMRGVVLFFDTDWTLRAVRKGYLRDLTARLRERRPSFEVEP